MIEYLVLGDPPQVEEALDHLRPQDVAAVAVSEKAQLIEEYLIVGGNGPQFSGDRECDRKSGQNVLETGPSKGNLTGFRGSQFGLEKVRIGLLKRSQQLGIKILCVGLLTYAYKGP